MSALVERVRRAKRLPSPAVARAVRLAANVSQADVAGELGVHRVTVARWESGDRRPSGDLLDRYVQLLADLREATGAG